MENRNEERLFDLIERKSYTELTSEERQFVDAQMSEADYTLQRTIMVEAGEFVDTTVPKPLVLTSKPRILPFIWTGIGSAAAAALLLLFFLPNDSIEFKLHVNERVPSASVDTVFVEKSVVDTVVHTVVKHEYIVRNAPATPTEDNFQLEAYSQAPMIVPTIRSSDLVNRGTSASEDQELSEFRPEPFIGM